MIAARNGSWRGNPRGRPFALGAAGCGAAGAGPQAADEPWELTVVSRQPAPKVVCRWARVEPGEQAIRRYESTDYATVRLRSTRWGVSYGNLDVVNRFEHSGAAAWVAGQDAFDRPRE